MATVLLGSLNFYSISQHDLLVAKYNTLVDQYNNLISHRDPSLKANVFFIYETFGADAYLAEGNVITNIGENETRDRFSGNGTHQFVGWLAVGNTTGTLQTKTQQDTQYGDRYIGTIINWTNSGDEAFNNTRKWQFTETVTLDSASIHWNATGDNTMYGIANFPDGAQIFHIGENLTVRYILTYNAND